MSKVGKEKKKPWIATRLTKLYYLQPQKWKNGKEWAMVRYNQGDGRYLC